MRSLRINFALSILDNIRQFSRPVLTDHLQRARLRLRPFLLRSLEPLAVEDEDVPLDGLQDHAVDLVSVAPLFGVGEGEVDDQVVECPRIELLYLVQQAIQMVGLDSFCLCRPFSDFYGSIGPQRCTLRHPELRLFITAVPLVHFPHLLVQSRHGQHCQPKAKRFCRPLIHTPRKVRVLRVLCAIQKADELRTDVGMRISVDLILPEVLIEAGQAV